MVFCQVGRSGATKHGTLGGKREISPSNGLRVLYSCVTELDKKKYYRAFCFVYSVQWLGMGS